MCTHCRVTTGSGLPSVPRLVPPVHGILSPRRVPGFLGPSSVGHSRVQDDPLGAPRKGPPVASVACFGVSVAVGR